MNETIEEYKVIGGRYVVNKDGTAFYREPLKDSSGFIDTPFMNFSPILQKLKRIDDGFIQTDKITFRALRRGILESPIDIEKKDMIGNQPHAKFGAGCRVYLGSKNIARCGEMMGMQCEDADIETVYTHSGWKIIDGERVFLNGTNSITANGLTNRYIVELDSDLEKCYGFFPCDDSDRYSTLLKLLPSAAPGELVIPSLAYCFMTPLNGMLRDKGAEPSFSFYLVGKTGTFKSSWSKILLGFFGRINYGDPAPINFENTKNAIGRKLALGADMVLLLDDRRPTNNAADKLKYESAEKYISSAIGDRAARGRLNADCTAKSSYTARCNLIVTAEEAFQNIGESSIARSVSVELKPGMIDFDKMAELQNKTRHLNAIMAEYIQWLIENYDSISDRLGKKSIEYRKLFTDAGHPRIATAFSNLMLGYSMLIAFLQHKDLITKNQAAEMKKSAEQIFLMLCQRQSDRVKSDKPTLLFINLLRQMLEIRQVDIIDLKEQTIDGVAVNPQTPSERTIGYRDDHYIYLIPDVSYTAVYNFYGRSGNTFPSSKAALWRQFKDEGKLMTDNERVDYRKTIKGKTGRYIAIRKDVLTEDNNA